LGPLDEGARDVSHPLAPGGGERAVEVAAARRVILGRTVAHEVEAHGYVRSRFGRVLATFRTTLGARRSTATRESVRWLGRRAPLRVPLVFRSSRRSVLGSRACRPQRR